MDGADCQVALLQPLMTVVFGNMTTEILKFTNRINDERMTLISDSIQLHQMYGVLAATPVSGTLQEAEDQLRRSINHDALLLVYVGIAMFGSTYLYMATWEYTGEAITRRIRKAYLASVLRQEVAYFDMMAENEISTRISNDIQLIQEGISDKAPMSVMFVATFVAGFIVAYIKSWQLSLALSSMLPCIIGAGAAMNVFITKHQQIELQYVAQAAWVAEESLSSVRTVKAFGIEQKLVDLYNESNQETTKQGRKKAVVQGIGLGVFFFVIYASYSLAFYFGSKLLARGDLQSGTVMTVIFSIFIGGFSLAMMAPNLTALSYAMAAAGKVFETIDRVSEIDSSSDEGLVPEHCDGKIEFRNVSFRYPARLDLPVLHDLSLQVLPNQTIALVGASGSGKSTILALLERFYDPDEGQVLLDGNDVKTLNTGWLRSQIGIVSQEPSLFSATIRENIEHGLFHMQWEKVGKEERYRLVEEAAEQANAHGFISQLPSGYDTLIGEGGQQLNDGQKQRLAIARAIVGGPRILLLDEATSALDSQSEGIVREALIQAAQGRTVIVIPHRLSAIEKADNIIVLGEGVILEQGSHHDLLARGDGPYPGLINAQTTLDGQVETRLYEEEEYNKEAETEESASKEADSDGMNEVKRTLTHQSKRDTIRKGKKEKKPRSLFYLLYRLALINKDQIWTLYIPGIFGSVASGAVYPAFSILFGRALRTYSRCQEIEQMACPEPQRSVMRNESDDNSLYFFIISILATFAIGIQNGNMILASGILMERLRSLSLKALLRSDVSHFDDDERTSIILTASLAENSQRINGLVGVTLGTIIQSISTLVIGWIIALAYDWRFALPLIATSPLTLSAGFFRLQLVILKDQKIKKAHEIAAQQACEAIASIRTVAAFNRQKQCIEQYKQELKKPAAITFRTAVYGNVLYAISQAVALPTIALAFWYGSRLLLEGHILGGHFFTVLTATVFASIQAGNAFSFATDISQAHGAAEDSLRLLDNVPEIDSDDSKGISLDECKGHVTFEDVHFGYRADKPVLRGMSMDVKPGSCCAVVGSSGSGKSAIVQLIERFYDPQAGRILIDGQDIREFNLKSVRRHIALVSKEPYLFQGTIGWNIALGAAGLDGDEDDGVDAIEKVTEQQMRKAARNANILNFIESLPDGFDTLIGGIDGKGAHLSEGQQLRIAVARGLIRDPAILLLDQVTSNLDSESEMVVQAALDRASRGRTTIAILPQNRLQSVNGKADQIYTLKYGHASLLAKNGIFYNSESASADAALQESP
jgi:ATP-binding cassette subfamily B (MDR/TAP) protein 1